MKTLFFAFFLVMTTTIALAEGKPEKPLDLQHIYKDPRFSLLFENAGNNKKSLSNDFLQLALNQFSLFNQLISIERKYNSALSKAMEAEKTMVDLGVKVIFDGDKSQSANFDAAILEANRLDSLLKAEIDNAEAIVKEFVKVSPTTSSAFNQAVLNVWGWELAKLMEPVHRKGSYDENDVLLSKTDCVDIAADGLIFKFIKTTIDKKPADIVNLLAQITEAQGCGAITDSAKFDLLLAESLDRTIARFPPEASQPVARVLARSLINLLLVVFDDTKLIGDAPVYQWLKRHKSDALDAFDADAPLHLTGLWLRIIGADGLIRLRLCKAGELESCVDGRNLVEAALDPNRLGLGICLLSEMVTVNPGPEGYACKRELCNPILSTRPNLQVYPNAIPSKSPYHIPTIALQQMSCAGGVNSNGESGVETGVSVTGFPETLGQCLMRESQKIENQKGMRKFLSCTRKSISELNSKTLPISKAGGPCAIAAGGGTNTSSKNSGLGSENDKKLSDAKEEAVKTLEDEQKQKKLLSETKKFNIEFEKVKFDDAIHQAIGKIKKVKVLSDESFNALPGCKPSDGCTMSSDKSIYVRASYIKDELVGTKHLARLIVHEAGHVILFNGTIKGEKDTSKLSGDDQHTIIQNWGFRCFDETSCFGPCGKNNDFYSKYELCMNPKKLQNFNEVTPENECGTTKSCDPDRPLSSKPLPFESCFTNSEPALNNTFCKNIRCANESVPQVVNGQCVCRNAHLGSGSGIAPIKDPCAIVLCAEGAESSFL